MVCLNKFAKFRAEHGILFLPVFNHGNSVFHAGTNFCFRLASYANGRLVEALEAVTEDCSVVVFSSSDDPLAKKTCHFTHCLHIGKRKQNGVSHGLPQDSWNCLPLFHAHIQIPPFGTWMPD